MAIGYPTVADSNIYAKSVRVFPAECRQGAATYRAKLTATVHYKVTCGGKGLGGAAGSISRSLGHVPIMVKVCMCECVDCKLCVCVCVCSRLIVGWFT